MGNTMMELTVSNIPNLSDLFSDLADRVDARHERERQAVGRTFNWNAAALSRALADCGRDWDRRTCRRWLDDDTRPDPATWRLCVSLAAFERRRARNARVRSRVRR